MTTPELIRVKAKIRALAAKTTNNGATEAEAIAAMKKVGELLDLYNLNLSETFLEESSCITTTFPYQASRCPPWSHIYVSIANYCQVRCWNQTGQSKIVFFGLEEDTRLAHYLATVVTDAINRLANDFKATLTHDRRLATKSFKMGLANRLAERLTRPPAPPTTGTDLVLIKKQKVEDDFKKLNMRLRQRRPRRTTRCSNSYTAGHKAGDRVNLNRPITQNTHETRLLT